MNEWKNNFFSNVNVIIRHQPAGTGCWSWPWWSRQSSPWRTALAEAPSGSVPGGGTRPWRLASSVSPRSNRASALLLTAQPASQLPSGASGTSHLPAHPVEGQSLPELSAPPASASSPSGPAAHHWGDSAGLEMPEDPVLSLEMYGLGILGLFSEGLVGKPPFWPANCAVQ